MTRRRVNKRDTSAKRRVSKETRQQNKRVSKTQMEKEKIESSQYITINKETKKTLT
jgi:hypothetical protein